MEYAFSLVGALALLSAELPQHACMQLEPFLQQMHHHDLQVLWAFQSGSPATVCGGPTAGAAPGCCGQASEPGQVPCPGAAAQGHGVGLFQLQQGFAALEARCATARAPCCGRESELGS